MTEPFTPADAVEARRTLALNGKDNPLYALALRLLDEVIRLNAELDTVRAEPSHSELVQKERSRVHVLQALCQVAAREINEGIEHACENVEGAPSHETLKLLEQAGAGLWIRAKVVDLDAPSPLPADVLEEKVEALKGEVWSLTAQVESLEAGRIMFRRLLLDVAEHGVTPCTLEEFRRAVGKPEWGPSAPGGLERTEGV